jgi:hypothetical protein
LNSHHWDIVYDQICFSASDASAIVDTISGKTARYVVCSSAAVYREPAPLDSKPLLRISEETFEPLTYRMREKNENPASQYDSLCRRQAHGGSRALPEGRLSCRLGTFSDHSWTGRLFQTPSSSSPSNFLGEAVNIVNPESEISLISSSDAAEFLAWLATAPHTGPFNACSDGSIALKTIVQSIEKATGRAAIVKHQPDDPFSIFRAEQSFTMSSGKARRFGFTFSPTQDGCANGFARKLKLRPETV